MQNIRTVFISLWYNLLKKTNTMAIALITAAGCTALKTTATIGVVRCSAATARTT
jgi:hypothetical protein